MGEFDDVWGSDHDEAWQGFEAELVKALVEDEFGIVEVEVMTVGGETDGCRPWVTVGEESGAYAAGVSGNSLLAIEHRLDDAQQQVLVAIGFREAEPQPAQEPEVRWFTREAGPEDLGMLVGLVVRALREVFGVVHPAFVDWDGKVSAPSGLDARRFPPRPATSGATTEGDPDAAVVLAWPTSATDLSVLVEDVVGRWLGHEPSRDDDGDIPIIAGDSVLYVQVSPSSPRVDLFAEVVVAVAHRRRALVEVNILNRGRDGATYRLEGDRVLMRRSVSAEPFFSGALEKALDETCRDLDRVATDLVQRLGGHAFLADPAEEVDS